tara:strand:- start:126 stop:494 length:369 start_codon:yes stop_codon:yes gene_type:complete
VIRFFIALSNHLCNDSLKEQNLSIVNFKNHFIELGSLVTIALTTVYFSITALYGEYGLFILFKKQIEEEQLLEYNSELGIELREWENLTKRISSDYLDLDLLDEQARKILRVARSDEAIFFY